MSEYGEREYQEMMHNEGEARERENANSEADAIARDIDAQHMIDDLNAKDAEIKALREALEVYLDEHKKWVVDHASLTTDPRECNCLKCTQARAALGKTNGDTTQSEEQ